MGLRSSDAARELYGNPEARALLRKLPKTPVPAAMAILKSIPDIDELAAAICPAKYDSEPSSSPARPSPFALNRGRSGTHVRIPLRNGQSQEYPLQTSHDRPEVWFSGEVRLSPTRYGLAVTGSVRELSALGGPNRPGRRGIWSQKWFADSPLQLAPVIAIR
jgi:hypothetical protein